MARCFTVESLGLKGGNVGAATADDLMDTLPSAS